MQAAANTVEPIIGEFYLFKNPETSKLTIGKATSIKVN